MGVVWRLIKGFLRPDFGVIWGSDVGTFFVATDLSDV